MLVLASAEWHGTISAKAIPATGPLMLCYDFVAGDAFYESFVQNVDTRDALAVKGDQENGLTLEEVQVS